MSARVNDRTLGDVIGHERRRVEQDVAHATATRQGIVANVPRQRGVLIVDDPTDANGDAIYLRPWRVREWAAEVRSEAAEAQVGVAGRVAAEGLRGELGQVRRCPVDPDPVGVGRTAASSVLVARLLLPGVARVPIAVEDHEAAVCLALCVTAQTPKRVGGLVRTAHVGSARESATLAGGVEGDIVRARGTEEEERQEHLQEHHGLCAWACVASAGVLVFVEENVGRRMLGEGL